jgi:hypothetical protein
MTLNATTLTITINSVAKVLNRIADDGYSAEYLLRETTGEFRAKTRHSTYIDKTRNNIVVERHTFEVKQTVYPAVAGDPNTIRKAYSVFEQDFGDVNATASYLYQGLVDASTDTVLSDLQAWMS